MATDFGMAIDCTTSVGRRFAFASGLRNLGNSLVRRLITPRGKLPWDPDYGTDMRDFLHSGATPINRFTAARAAQDEVTKDERILSAIATAAYVGNGILRIDLACQTADGPFQLILAVDALTVEILRLAA